MRCCFPHGLPGGIYYLKDGLKTREATRQEQEKPLLAEGEDTPFPGWDAVEAEAREADPAILLTVRDADGNVVRRLEGPTKKGIHRVAWDLRFPATQAIGVRGSYISPEVRGYLAAPGTYSLALAQRLDGTTTELAGPVRFEVKPLRKGALDGAEPAEVVAFWKRTDALQRKTTAAGQVLRRLNQRIEHLSEALGRSLEAVGDLDEELEGIANEHRDLRLALGGNDDKDFVGELEPPTVNSRLSAAMIGTQFSTYGPTPTHLRSMQIAESEFAGLRERLNQLITERIPAFEARLQEAGAPWTPGQPVPE
jgi:hypothetical protein